MRLTYEDGLTAKGSAPCFLFEALSDPHPYLFGSSSSSFLLKGLLFFSRQLD
ncbi:hypothetical protein BSBH6_02921 [Bacillus subtilis]|nr:hypothetical protein BSBH6_02921 [Bacillus subtilis]RPK23887.1 hypothetical protein BH5_02918 [Bacillus subtilis]